MSAPLPNSAGRLQYGQFFGPIEARRQVSGFSVSVREPDRTLSIARHTHEDAHFILLLDGHYLSTAEGAGDVCDGPALIYNPPGTTHQDRFYDGLGSFLALSVSSERLTEALQLQPLLEGARRLAPGVSIGVAWRLAIECRCWRGTPNLVIEGLCLDLLSEVARTPERRSRGQPAWLSRARDLLHDRAADDVEVSEIARAAGVHPIHLARTFRQHMGCGPGEYLRHCRVERAAALLRSSTAPLVEVALRCGFADQSHFSHAFQREYGISPGRFRRRAGRSEAR